MSAAVLAVLVGGLLFLDVLVPGGIIPVRGSRLPGAHERQASDYQERG